MSASRTTETWCKVLGGPVVLGSFCLLAQCSSSSSPGPTTTPDAEAPDASRDGSQITPTPDASMTGPEDAKAAVDAPAEAAPAAHCDAQTPCSGSASVCCNGVCVNTAADPANCGACGVACTSTQFCSGTSCNEAIIANVCANPRGTVVDDQETIDNQAGLVIGNALKSSCSPATTIPAPLDQSFPGILEAVTNRPITGVGDTFITGGGAFYQLGINYMEAKYTGIYLQADGTTANFVDRLTAMNAFSTPESVLTASHDYFLVQVAVEPVSGTLVFYASGVLGPGTVAGAYYTATELIPNRAMYPLRWYVFEWTDMNENSTPDQGDTFTMKASGM